MVDLVKDMQSTGQIAQVDTGFIQPNVKKEFSSAPIVNQLAGDLMNIAGDSYKQYLTQGLGERLENIASTAQMEMGNAASFEEAASITDLTKKFGRLKNVAEQKGGMDRVRIQAEAEIKKALTRHPGMAQAYGQVASQVLGFNPTGSAMAIAEQEYSLNAKKAQAQLDYYAADAAKYGMTLEEINSNPKMAEEYATLRQGAKTITALKQKKELESLMGASGPSQEDSDRMTRDHFHKNRGVMRSTNFTRAGIAAKNLYKDALAQKGYNLGENEQVTSALIEKYITPQELQLLGAQFRNLRDASKESDGVYEYRSAFDGKDEQFNRYTTEVYDDTWGVYAHAFDGAAAVDMVLNYSNKINEDNMSVMTRDDTMKLFTSFSNLGIDLNLFKDTQTFTQFVVDTKNLIDRGGSLLNTNADLSKVTKDSVRDLGLVLKAWKHIDGEPVNGEVADVFRAAVSIIANPERVDPAASLEMVRVVNAMDDGSLSQLYDVLETDRDGKRAFTKGMVTHTTRLASNLSRVVRDNEDNLGFTKIKVNDEGLLSLDIDLSLEPEVIEPVRSTQMSILGARQIEREPKRSSSPSLLGDNKHFRRNPKLNTVYSPKYKALEKYIKEYNDTINSINKLGIGGAEESLRILDFNGVLGFVEEGAS